MFDIIEDYSRREIILENSEKIICNMIEQNSRVLDLGCGEGILLDKLKKEKNVRGVGIEINEKNVINCITKGLSVCQGNIDEGLTDYADKSFDYIIINNTLQQIYKPEYVINEMRRVGKTIIIGMASFTFWKIRLTLLLNGKLPKTSFYQYDWYNTPNIRVISVRDFFQFCKKNNLDILKFYGNIRNRFYEIPIPVSNLLSKYCMFVCK